MSEVTIHFEPGWKEQGEIQPRGDSTENPPGKTLKQLRFPLDFGPFSFVYVILPFLVKFDMELYRDPHNFIQGGLVREPKSNARYPNN